MASIIENIFNFPSFNVIKFLFILTIIQFWWIAVWGIAYIAINYIAGGNKQKEFMFYICLMLITLFVVKAEPTLIEKM